MWPLCSPLFVSCNRNQVQFCIDYSESEAVIHMIKCSFSFPCPIIFFISLVFHCFISKGLASRLLDHLDYWRCKCICIYTYMRWKCIVFCFICTDQQNNKQICNSMLQSRFYGRVNTFLWQYFLLATGFDSEKHLYVLCNSNERWADVELGDRKSVV